ncbi:unnamed protein product [Hyaloperonospora brassicae]|uniref:Amino acid transporter transmembrane domain-containing protein n=1 Tax=Hyaloperonospora brassicae TaxID=162125 RepID=A0AAV0TY04_HYABA|nr:unnamed protein product [Hyaloperonospora brassicae]
MVKRLFFTLEDAKISFSFFGRMRGVGTPASAPANLPAPVPCSAHSRLASWRSLTFTRPWPCPKYCHRSESSKALWAAFAGRMGTLIADGLGIAINAHGMRDHPSVPPPELSSASMGTVVLAYIAMQMHVTIAFAVLINPAFYIAERLVLGMHEKRRSRWKPVWRFTNPAPGLPKTSEVSAVSATSSRRLRTSVFPLTGELTNDHELEAAEYRGANAIKYIVLRLAIIVVLVVLSIIFADYFSDFVDFVGASAITANCIVLPTIFYP